MLLRAPGTGVGAPLRALIALAVLWEIRHAWLAHRSVARIDEALEGIEPAEADEPRVPRSHLVDPAARCSSPGASGASAGSRFAEVDGTRLRLDIYRPADDDPDDDGPRPAVIQVHGGGWFAGSRYEQGIPLLNHLASDRLGRLQHRLPAQPPGDVPRPDRRRQARDRLGPRNADELGIDPEMICITGGSAGGHLTALAGLTENDPAYQPGFEDADTSLAAAVPFYGVYDLTNANGFYYTGCATGCSSRSSSSAATRTTGGCTATRRRASASTPTRRRSWSSTASATRSSRSATPATSSSACAPSRSSRSATSSCPAAEHAFDLWPSERTAQDRRGDRPLPDRDRARRRGAAPTDRRRTPDPVAEAID